MKAKYYILTSLLCITVLFNLIVPAPSISAAEPAPIFKLLGFLPANTALEVSYVDYRALVEARPGAVQPTSPDDWKALNDKRELSLGLYNATIMGVTDAFAPNLVIAGYAFRGGAEVLAQTGINGYTVERTFHVAFSNPFSILAVWNGRFDTDAIAKAYQMQGYAQNDLKGWTLWCGPVGCEQGAKVNPAQRVQGNPFGGDLGRQQPVVATSEFVMSDPNLPRLTDAVDAYQGGANLAKGSGYMALAEAFTQSGTLLQASFMPLKNTDNPAAGTATLTPAQVATLTAAYGLDEKQSGLLPPSRLIGFAHVATGKDILTYVGLVYDSEAEAKDAAAKFPGQFSKAPSIIMRGKLFQDRFQSYQATFDPTTVYASASAGKFVMLFGIRTPIEGPEIVSNGAPRTSGLAYRALINAYIQRDTLWLAQQAAAK